MPEIPARLWLHFLPAVEALLLLAAVLQAWRAARRNPQPVRRLDLGRGLHFVAQHRRWAVATVTLLPLLTRVAFIPILGIPQPRFADEFSFLLAADTYHSGRLTNPTHPFWKFFESFHIIQQPTYMSMYPPGQGLALAAGHWLLGNPWLGQWLVTGLLCGAICWMLQGWLPSRWAFYGGIIAVLRIGILSYWMNTYMIGSLPALGGALVLGAWPRLQRTARFRNAVLMALGLVILANTRPFEGLVLSIPVAVAMLIWLFSRIGPPQSAKWLRVALPIAAILLVVGSAMGYDNWRVTSSPVRMAYQVNRETYAQAPYFLMLPPRVAPTYNHAEMQRFYENLELKDYRSERTVSGYLASLLRRSDDLWLFYFSSALTVPCAALMLAGSSVFRNRRYLLPLALVGTLLAGLLPQTWTMPHYAAPAASLAYLFVTLGARYLYVWRRHSDGLGAAMVRIIPAVLASMVILRVAAVAFHAPVEQPWPRGNLDRAGILAHLQSSGGRHLIFVSYAPDHDVNQEWVYNRADIDASRVVWARDRGNAENHKLIAYFHDREVWSLRPDLAPAALIPYPEPAPHP